MLPYNINMKEYFTFDTIPLYTLFKVRLGTVFLNKFNKDQEFILESGNNGRNFVLDLFFKTDDKTYFGGSRNSKIFWSVGTNVNIENYRQVENEVHPELQVIGEVDQSFETFKYRHFKTLSFKPITEIDEEESGNLCYVKLTYTNGRHVINLVKVAMLWKYKESNKLEVKIYNPKFRVWSNIYDTMNDFLYTVTLHDEIYRIQQIDNIEVLPIKSDEISQFSINSFLRNPMSCFLS